MVLLTEIYSVEHISLAVVHPAMLLICEIYFVEHMKLICCLVLAMLSVNFVLYLAHKVNLLVTEYSSKSW